MAFEERLQHDENLRKQVSDLEAIIAADLLSETPSVGVPMKLRSQILEKAKSTKQDSPD